MNSSIGQIHAQIELINSIETARVCVCVHIKFISLISLSHHSSSTHRTVEFGGFFSTIDSHLSVEAFWNKLDEKTISTQIS